MPAASRPTLPLQGRVTNMYSRFFLRLNGKVRFATKSHGETLMDGTRHLKLCGLAALGLALSLGTASAQDKTFELKLSHWVPPSHPSQQLGKAFDHYDMARDGIADFVYVNPGYQPGRFPIISAGELPFLVGQAKGGNRAIDAWYRKYAAAEMKDVHYCFSFVLDPVAWH